MHSYDFSVNFQQIAQSPMLPFWTARSFLLLLLMLLLELFKWLIMPHIRTCWFVVAVSVALLYMLLHVTGAMQRIQMQPPRATSATSMEAGTLSAVAPGTASAKP